MTTIKPYLYIGAGCLLIGYHLYALHNAVNDTIRKCKLETAQAQITQDNKERQLKKDYDAKKSQIANELIEKQAKAQIITKIIYKDRIQYVEKNPSLIVDVPRYWMWDINSAITETTLPTNDSTRELANTPTTVGIDKIADTIVNNAIVCNGYITQIEAWQQWYKEMQKINEKNE